MQTEEAAGAKGETHRNVQMAGRVCGASGKEVRAGKENWDVVYTDLRGVVPESH